MEQIRKFLRDKGFALALLACLVAAAAAGVEYHRLLRPASPLPAGSVVLGSAAQAAQYLARLDFGWNVAPHSQQRFTSFRSLMISAYRAASNGRTAA